MYTQKLLDISSSAIAPSEAVVSIKERVTQDLEMNNEIWNMLRAKNGFYAFEGALHVFPSTKQESLSNEMSIQRWNENNLWRSHYEHADDGLLFFAEDIFGVQFATNKDNVVTTFDPETAVVTPMARSIEEWSRQILQNFDELTGFSIASAWQSQYGRLKIGNRLLPKTPFVLGGKFEIKNMGSVSAAEAMRYRADLWKQMRDLPDGATVRLKVLPTLNG